MRADFLLQPRRLYCSFQPKRISHVNNLTNIILTLPTRNAIRGLLMHLCKIPEDRINAVEIPTGLPLIYDKNIGKIRLLQEAGPDGAITGTFCVYYLQLCLNLFTRNACVLIIHLLNMLILLWIPSMNLCARLDSLFSSQERCCSPSTNSETPLSFSLI